MNARVVDVAVTHLNQMHAQSRVSSSFCDVAVRKYVEELLCDPMAMVIATPNASGAAMVTQDWWNQSTKTTLGLWLWSEGRDGLRVVRDLVDWGAKMGATQCLITAPSTLTKYYGRMGFRPYEMVLRR
jgi:hypothetical protein